MADDAVAAATSWSAAAARPCFKVAVRDSIKLMERHAPARALVLVCSRPTEAIAADEVR